MKDKKKKESTSKKDFKRYRKYQKKEKGLADEGSWSDSNNDLDFESSDDERSQMANLYLIAM